MKFTKSLLITKLKATGVHLCLSLAIFVYLVYQIVFNWYPVPYFSIDGGWQGIRLIGAVDLVLGPLITFLIFDLSKKRREIVFDLLIIAVIQFSALAYGIYATYSQRPVAIILIDEFVISAIEQHYGDKLGSLDELKAYSNEHPPVIYADLPMDRTELAEINRIKIEDKVLEHAQMALYGKQPELKIALELRQKTFDSRLDSYQERGRYETWLRENDRKAGSVLIAPFTGRYGRVWLVFDLEARYLDYF